MPDLASIIQTGAGNPWLYLPVAIVLGALHALEPGHSKSLMAAFIVAVRGTTLQAVLLGVSAAVGHTIVVWALAVLGLTLGDRFLLDRAEPWLVLASGLLIMLLALRLFRSIHRHAEEHDHAHEDEHHADHHHHHDHAHAHSGADHHDHAHAGDTHMQEHAREIEQRFSHRRDIGNWEIAWFGFTGGLLPCPAAFAVLLICLHLKAFTLGIAMVAAFSIGLAMTLVSIGVIAVWGARHAASRWSGFERIADRLPYISGVIVLCVGLLITVRALWDLGSSAVPEGRSNAIMLETLGLLWS